MSEDKENKPCDFSLASISKREVYAAVAMHALIASPKSYVDTAESIASAARIIADNMMREMK